MGGPELVFELFSECRSSDIDHVGLCLADGSSSQEVWRVSRVLLVAMVIKGALTVVTFGLKLPCGIFIPSLGVGACAGRILGIWVQWMQYQKPGFGGFLRPCGEQGNCKLVYTPLFKILGLNVLLQYRHYSRLVCYGWRCSDSIWCYGVSHA